MAKPPTGPHARTDAAPDTAVLLARLERAVPRPAVELDFADPFQLLVATILSAQAQDRVINEVTPALFARYPGPAELAAAEPAELEGLVRRTGFFRNKAKAIRAAARALVDRHEGEVPRTMDALVALPGVARKTANVVLGQAFGVAAGVVVDTHAGRVARRLGLTSADDAEAVEADLMRALPQGRWIDGGMRLVLHGRYRCVARAPACAACPLAELCPSAPLPADGAWEDRADAEAALIAARGGGGGAPSP